MRAYAYICSLGGDGLQDASETAVLNANYLLARLREHGVAEYLPLAYGELCMHEFVLSGGPMKQRARIKTLDLAKRLLDFGFHPPTVYFPLLVEEALMVEPTETETKETLDAFAEAIAEILREAAEEGPEIAAERALHDARAPPGRGRGRQAAGHRAQAPGLSLRDVRIFSGIQPTGRKHLGNYIGAITQYVAAQERGEGIFCIVDLHAITVAYDPAELRERLYDTAAVLLAAGLDPERCILFRQSDVHEHTELTWLLSSVTAYGELPRMTPVQGQGRLGSASSSPPGCSSTRCCRPPTCSPTAPRRCRSARTSASTSS